MAHAQPAVVVGAGLNGLGVLRSLAVAGVPVVVVDSRPDQPAMLSRYGRKYRYIDDAPDAVVHALEALAAEWPEQRAVLLLTQEETVTTVAAHHARLANRYHLTLPSADVLAPLLRKDCVHSLAESMGARVPKTVHIQGVGDIAKIDALHGPLVIKPARRDGEYARVFLKAYRVDDHGAARSLLQRILPVLADVLVQEWIDGSDSDIYFCLQYLPASGGVPTSFVGRKIRSWPPRVGGTASCTAAPEAQELAATTTAFFHHAGFSGLAGMEYKRDAVSGEYLIVEPTVGRTDYQEEVATLNGVNIPLAAYCDALGMTAPEPRQVSPVRIWRHRMSDRRSAALMPQSETREPGSARVVDATWRATDPMPAVVPLASRMRRRLLRLSNRFTGANDGVQP